MAKRRHLRRRVTAPVVHRDKSRPGTWRGYVVRDGKRHYARGATRGEVLEKLTDAQAVSAEEAAAGRMTVRGLRLRFEGSQRDKAANTRAYYTAALSLAGALDFYRLSEIPVAAILDVLDGVESTARREDVYVALRAMFAAGVRWGILERNPMALIDRPRHNAKRPDPFQASEVAAILTAAAGTRYAAAVRVGLTLGLRPGEIFGLQWDDWDAEAKTLHVRRQAAETSGKVEIKPPKTAAGIRSILLPAEVSDALALRRAAALKEGLASAPWIVPNRTGGVTRRSNFANRHWGPLLDRAGVPRRGLHQMRHTAATMLLNGGVPITLVARILGHERPSTTLDVYGHLLTGDQKKAVEFWDRKIS